MLRRLFREGVDELQVQYCRDEDRVRVVVSAHHPTAPHGQTLREVLPNYLTSRPCAAPGGLTGTAVVLLGHPHPAPSMLDAGRVHWSPLRELGTRWPALLAALLEAPAGAAVLVRMRRVAETPVCEHLRLAARGYHALAATTSRTGLTTLGTPIPLALLAKTCAETAERYAGRFLLRCEVLTSSPTPALYDALSQLPADTGRRWQVHQVDASLLSTWAGWDLPDSRLAEAVRVGSPTLPWVLASLVDDIEASGIMRLPIAVDGHPPVVAPAGHRSGRCSTDQRRPGEMGGCGSSPAG